MKKILALLLLSYGVTNAQSTYWQQEVSYTMNIDMDVEKHQFTGDQEIVYTNNSPDTLTQVFYHLYFNAFQPGSMMDVRSRNIPDPDKRIGNRIEALTKEEIGYHQVEWLKQDEQALSFEVNETVLQAALAKPLAPGSSTTLKMKFNSQVPIQIRRSGRNNAEGVDYTMTQWYPKLAEYDRHGWHPDPYVAREYYGVFGSFDVTIAIPYYYVVGGTGTLQSSEGIWRVKSEEGGVSTMELVPHKGSIRKWRFKADNIHDFAWAADTGFVHTMSKSKGGVDLHYYYLPKYSETWTRLPKYTETFFDKMSERYGKYPYPQFSVIQGGDGGMEYPMCTMLKGTGKMNGLVGVMVHESIHNWYYGILASNENQYPWMDEGFTSYAESDVLNLMTPEPVVNAHKGSFRGYNFLVKSGQIEPLSTPADYFGRNRTYGISAYSRGEVFLAQLRYIMGEEVFLKAMRAYFEKWKFKHPDPWDFIKVMEDVSGIQLDWYLNFWLNTVKSVDYGIKEVKSKDRGLAVELERIGEMPMPLRVTIKTKSGGTFEYYIPLVSMFGGPDGGAQVLEPWPWTHPNYTLRSDVKMTDVESIVIDHDEFMADINRENNTYKATAEEEEQ